ncbi:3D domain-containing protein [Sporomusa aerivorans]|uniref:3D domain-containing protein n=1 Tax=Sporomusa aerivorans TaxID=204936 RepID=UPI00352AB17B
MKNKLAAITLMVLAMPLFSPFMPKAEAGFLEDRLAEVAVGNPNAMQIQDLIKIKEYLGQDNNKANWGSIAQAALERTGKSQMIGNIATVAGQLTGQDQSIDKDNVVKMVESAIRSTAQEKIQAEVSDRLSGYQQQIPLLSALLNNNNLVPKAAEANNSLSGAPQNYRKLIDMKATAYGPGPMDNGKWNDSTYVGSKVKKGVAAVDPNVIPMGTKLWIEGYGPAIANDQGSAIKGNRIDLAFDTRQEALDYGIQNVKVYVLK